MENSALPMPPICQYCNSVIVTVKHLLITCPALMYERMRCRLFRENDQVTLKICIGEGAPIEQTIEYLKRLDAYNTI